MTSTGESQPRPYYLELLNAPEDVFIEAAQDIPHARGDLEAYATRCKTETPGLYQHLGGWLGVIRKQLEGVASPAAIEMTDGAMTVGSLMTYEMLCRVAERMNEEIPNPPFDPTDFVDSEPPAHEQLLREGRTLDLSRRAYDMPDRFPVLFEANICMLTQSTDRSTEAVRETIFSPISRDGMFPYEVANFLAGSVEMVVPLERFAQVQALEEQL